MATDSRRLSILSGQEIEGLYGLPRFTGSEAQWNRKPGYQARTIASMSLRIDD